jgi:5-methylthioadenosine/S-adenosylhomocysteine deaminase
MLEMATLGGARAMGLDGIIGSLEPGKRADIIAVSLGHIAQQPVHDIHNTLLFATSARDVVMTMVNGIKVLEV